MSGRRRSVSWASTPDEGDAAVAAREIAEWAALQSAPRDWEGVLSGMRERLMRVWVSPLVRADPVCRGILADLRPDGDVAALDAAMSALAERLDAVLAGRRVSADPRPSAMPAVTGGAVPTGPARRRLYRI